MVDGRGERHDNSHSRLECIQSALVVFLDQFLRPIRAEYMLEVPLLRLRDPWGKTIYPCSVLVQGRI